MLRLSLPQTRLNTGLLRTEEVGRRNSSQYVTSAVTVSTATIETESFGKNKADTLFSMPHSRSSNAQDLEIVVKRKSNQLEEDLIQVEETNQKQKGSFNTVSFSHNVKATTIIGPLPLQHDAKNAEIAQRIPVPSKDGKNRHSVYSQNKINSSTSEGSGLKLLSNPGIMHAPSDMAYLLQKETTRCEDVKTKGREYPMMNEIQKHIKTSKELSQLALLGTVRYGTSSGIPTEIYVKDLCISTPEFQILRHVTVALKNGELNACLGPSGAGKSSLFDFLTGRNIEANVTNGVVIVNGREVTPEWRSKNIAYVEQDSSLLSTSTVREALMFAAKIQRADTISEDHVIHKVEEALHILQLDHRQHNFIGGNVENWYGGIRSLSGGERRRLVIGEQLVRDAEIIVLDEPTSGVDSAIALEITILLKELCKRGKTVFASFHLPSSQMFQRFDNLCLMANGQVIYNESRAAAVSFFNLCNEPCPIDYSPADHYLQVISNRERAATISKIFKTEFQGRNKLKRTKEAFRYPNLTVSSSFSTQFRCLFLRKSRQWARDYVLLGAQILNYVLAGLLFGIQYRPFVLDSEEIVNGAFQFRRNLFVLVLMVAAFTPGFTSIAKFEAERGLLRRETASKRYGFLAHFISLTACSWVVESISAIVFSICFYFLSGLARDRYAGCIFILIAFMLLNETLGPSIQRNIRKYY
mmetsp:Transcript_13304/g.18580  ORF Transcript_13304/g.18580 Transcript_13304/m.18580 type:complete len:697 (+) Transcript_13304:554-2644(+)